MGGEGGAALTVPAALQALSQDPSLSLTLVGNQQEIQPMLQAVPAMASKLHASRLPSFFRRLHDAEGQVVLALRLGELPC